MFEEFFIGSIVGQIDPEAEWDSYVATMVKSGVEEQQRELEKAPLVSGLEQGELVY